MLRQGTTCGGVRKSGSVKSPGDGAYSAQPGASRDSGTVFSEPLAVRRSESVRVTDSGTVSLALGTLT